MLDSHITTIEQLASFVQLKTEIGFCIIDKQARYEWIDETLRKFKYHRLKRRGEKSVVNAYIRKVTGLSKIQTKRLIRRHKRRGELKLGHGHLSGQATRSILKREYETFHHEAYQTISRISSSHIYNIRGGNRQYNSSKAKWVARTKATAVNIGTRAKPCPEGKPGYLRVDTVHSGDLNGEKGAYHINIVDEVTQWEMLAIVPNISEYALAPVVETLISLYPFVILEFHSDNGSEFINHVVHVRIRRGRGWNEWKSEKEIQPMGDAVRQTKITPQRSSVFEAGDHLRDVGKDCPGEERQRICRGNEKSKNRLI